jgi:hypothetical protein
MFIRWEGSEEIGFFWSFFVVLLPPPVDDPLYATLAALASVPVSLFLWDVQMEGKIARIS